MSESSTSKETPAELLARAARYRQLAQELPPDMRRSMLEAVAELEATAAELEAHQS